ncbi:MAG: PQQ-binding-like beta-propeller repeat protein, partial [Armatimonadetes bacterium]|nr:PQQ-binding-like beta-propeller repeat protein [Armatimonadota bacterium]
MKRRLTILIAATALTLALGCSAALAQDEWRMFRHDQERTGTAMDGNDGVLGAFRPAPIWCFPMPDTVFQEIDNSDLQDPSHPTYDFTQSGFTVVTEPDVGFVGDDYAVAVTDGKGKTPPELPTGWAEWRYVFPALRSGGFATCIISVWFPSRGDSQSLPPTEDAHYTVTITRGGNAVVSGPYIIDQTSGAAWKQLPGVFILTENDVLVVRVTTLTEKMDENEVLIPSRVFADDLKIEAVAIDQPAGTVIASPAVAVDNPIVVSCLTENGRGVVYGIGREKDSGLASSPDDRGQMIWRFPAVDHDWIETGISSSPTIANIGGEERAVVAAADGQICLIPTAPTASRPSNGQWPGYVIDDLSMIVSGGWSDSTSVGYRGTGYKYIQAVPEGSPTAATVRWSYLLQRSPTDRYYDVYAWIPPAGSRTYVLDAHYSDVDGATNLVIPSTTTRISQGSGGKWLKIRSRWLVPANPDDTVTIGFQLTNETIGGVSNYVVADALKIVPYGIGRFDHSSPVVEAPYVYIGSIGEYKGKSIGKICKLRYDFAEPEWVYPTGTGVIGPVYASPTLHGDTVYCASTDGHVYALNKDTGALKWMCPPAGDQPLPEISSTTAVADDLAGTTYIYIATGAAWSAAPNPGAEGRVICIKDQANTDGTFSPIYVWTYPAAERLGAFKYASPLLKDPAAGGTNPDIFLGSTDGQFYAIDGLGDPAANTTTETWRLNFAAAINSSAAGTFAGYPYRDGTLRTSAAPMAFLGAGSRIYGVELGVTPGVQDWWYDLLGDAHSSPAMTNDRIYIGDMAGHTWAFATGTDPSGGGGGVQEGWNTTISPEPPNTGSNPGLGGRNSEPEIDVFTKAEWLIFKQSILDPAENGTPPFARSDFRDHVRDHGGTRPETYTYEWGEDIYIVVWNLLDPNRRLADQALWRKPAVLAAGGFTDNYPGSVEITIKSGAPGKEADA